MHALSSVRAKNGDRTRETATNESPKRTYYKHYQERINHIFNDRKSAAVRDILMKIKNSNNRKSHDEPQNFVTSPGRRIDKGETCKQRGRSSTRKPSATSDRSPSTLKSIRKGNPEEQVDKGELCKQRGRSSTRKLFATSDRSPSTLKSSRKGDPEGQVDKGELCKQRGRSSTRKLCATSDRSPSTLKSSRKGNPEGQVDKGELCKQRGHSSIRKPSSMSDRSPSALKSSRKSIGRQSVNGYIASVACVEEKTDRNTCKLTQRSKLKDKSKETPKTADLCISDHFNTRNLISNYSYRKAICEKNKKNAHPPIHASLIEMGRLIKSEREILSNLKSFVTALQSSYCSVSSTSLKEYNACQVQEPTLTHYNTSQSSTQTTEEAFANTISFGTSLLSKPGDANSTVDKDETCSCTMSAAFDVEYKDRLVEACSSLVQTLSLLCEDAMEQRSTVSDPQSKTQDYVRGTGGSGKDTSLVGMDSSNSHRNIVFTKSESSAALPPQLDNGSYVNHDAVNHTSEATPSYLTEPSSQTLPTEPPAEVDNVQDKVPALASKFPTETTYLAQLEVLQNKLQKMVYEIESNISKFEETIKRHNEVLQSAITLETIRQFPSNPTTKSIAELQSVYHERNSGSFVTAEGFSNHLSSKCGVSHHGPDNESLGTKSGVDEQFRQVDDKFVWVLVNLQEKLRRELCLLFGL